MQTKLAVSGLSLALALAVAPAAVAQSPNKPPDKPEKPATVTLDAKPAMIVFAGATTLSGRLAGGNAGGVTIRLEQDATRPYGDSYAATAVTAKTANNGSYTLGVKPRVNTQYRVVAQAAAPVTSAAKLVRVRLRVGLRLSDTTPRRGSLVRFSGSVSPAHDGRTAYIQRRSSTGGFVTVARAALRDAGTTKSTYSRRVRVSRDGVYRVKVSSDGDHANGFSRMRSLAVHG